MRADPDAQALHLRHPVTTIWDDHDLSDNAWRTGAKHHDPEHDGDWDARVRAAAQARPRVAARPARSTRTTRWSRGVRCAVGDLAELILLDTRFAGRDRQAGDDEAPPLDDPTARCSATRNGRGCEERLRERRPAVGRSCAAASWSTSSSCPGRARSRRSTPVLPNGYAVLDGRVLHDDQWDGYPAERAA